MVNIAFAGGGTGGHVFPIKSLIEFIKKDNDLDNIFNKIYWFGEKNSLEEKIAKDINIDNLYFIGISSGKIRRERSISGFIKNFLDIFKFIFGIFQSFYLIFVNKIDIIFCKGGYVAGPIVFAGWVLGKKIYVHESDTIPGIANVFAAKFAKTVFTGFPDVFKKGVFVGQILGDNIVEFKKEFDFDLSPSKTNILISGGSQGARTIFESVLNILELDNMDNFNFFIVLGTKNIDYKTKFISYKNVKTFDFVSQSQMGYLCSVCDTVIGRGGATSLAEQKLFGMKLIIIPLPYTGGNHQYYNGLYYQKNYGDILILQDNLLTENLRKTIFSIEGYKKENILIPEVSSSKKAIFDKILSD